MERRKGPAALSKDKGGFEKGKGKGRASGDDGDQDEDEEEGESAVKAKEKKGKKGKGRKGGVAGMSVDELLSGQFLDGAEDEVCISFSKLSSSLSGADICVL